METMSLSMSGGSSEGEDEDGVKTDATIVACPADGYLVIADWVGAERSCGFGGYTIVLV